MADVTISSLDQGTPSSTASIPFSNGSTTLRVAPGNILANAGNVGIGTTNPAGKLDVYGTAYFHSIELGKGGQTGNRNVLIDFTGDDTYTDYGFRIIRGDTGANANSVLVHRGTGGLFLQTVEAGPIILQTTSTERLRIDSSGNVGIGTSAPSSKLHVVGDANVTGKLSNAGVSKAWVSFDGGAGTQVGAEFRCTLRASYNVDRVVRAGTGEYIVYFAVAFADANYCALSTGGGGDTNANNSALDCWTSQFNAAYVRVGLADNGTSNNVNGNYVNVAVYKQ